MQGKIIGVSENRSYATVQYGKGKLSALIEDGIRQFVEIGLPVLFNDRDSRGKPIIYWVGDRAESAYPPDEENPCQ